MLPFLIINREKKYQPPAFPLAPFQKIWDPPKKSSFTAPHPPNRGLAYFSYLIPLFINRAMTCTCDLWPVTCILYLQNLMFHLNLYQIS